MLTDGRTDGRTDARTDDGRKVITIAHPEQSSGELKMHCERDINLTDVHYSRTSNKIFVAYSMYLEFLFHPSIY